MEQYSCEVVWPNPSDVTRTDAVDFWLQESALPMGKAIERTEQLLVVCRDLDGKVAAVSTVVPSVVSTLGLRCFYFRAFVGRDHRTKGLRASQLIYRLIRQSYDALNERFQKGIDPDVVGLYLEVENRSVSRHRNELVWTDLGANLVFVGRLPDGRHARVWYFESAKIPMTL